MKWYITYRQTFLHSITPKHHISDIHCLDFMEKKNQPWVGISRKTRWEMLHSTIAKIERRTSSFQRESKKIYSSALQNVPELKRGGGGRE